MVSCSRVRIASDALPSGPSHLVSMPCVWCMASANVWAAFFSLKDADVILRCRRHRLPSIVTTLRP